MLDQMSGGRLELGCGRGSGPAEIQYFSQTYDTAQQVYSDTLDMILKVLTEGRISFPGAPDTFQDLPLQIECVQKPHPPLWYGAHSVEGSRQAAFKRQNIVSLDTAAETRTYVDEFASTHRAQWCNAPMPMMGISRFSSSAKTTRRHAPLRVAPIDAGGRISPTRRGFTATTSCMAVPPISIRCRV